jgi:hypothetical protein
MANYKFSEDAATTVIDFDLPGSGTGTLTDASGAAASAWVDMADYSRLTAYYFPTVATGKIQQMRIRGSAAATGTSPGTIVNHGSGTPTALTGYSLVECSTDDMAAVSDTYRYLGVEISLSVGTDEGRLVLIRHGARYKKAGLSASTD